MTVSLSGAAILSRRLGPQMRIRPADWDHRAFRALRARAVGGLNDIGTVLFLARDDKT
jgi:hypothetical protein